MRNFDNARNPSSGVILSVARVFDLVMVLSSLPLVWSLEESYESGVQRKVGEVLLFIPSPNAPIIITIDCRLDSSFMQGISASHLTLVSPRSAQWLQGNSSDDMDRYAKVYPTENTMRNDYAVIGLYCDPNNQEFEFPSSEHSKHLLMSASGPMRDATLLYFAKEQNVLDTPKNRNSHLLRGCLTRIYLLWNNQTGEMVFHSAYGLTKKWYRSFLDLHFLSYETQSELSSLISGAESIVFPHVEKVELIRDRSGGASRNWGFTVELRDSAASNSSIFADVMYSRSKMNYDKVCFFPERRIDAPRML